jgi:hypothetical protein
MNSQDNSTTAARVNAFSDLDDFQPKSKPSPKPVATEVIDQIAEDNGFPSRSAKAAAPSEPIAAPHSFERPRKTRAPKQTVQINIRVEVEQAKRFYAHVDALGVDLSEFLTALLDKYERTNTK